MGLDDDDDADDETFVKNQPQIRQKSIKTLPQTTPTSPPNPPNIT